MGPTSFVPASRKEAMSDTYEAVPQVTNSWLTSNGSSAVPKER